MLYDISTTHNTAPYHIFIDAMQRAMASVEDEDDRSAVTLAEAEVTDDWKEFEEGATVEQCDAPAQEKEKEKESSSNVRCR